VCGKVMSNSDILAIIAIVFSFCSVLVTVIYTFITHKATKITSANLEHELYKEIKATKEKVSDILLEIPKLKATDEAGKVILQQFHKALQENHVNAFEVACGNYLDKNVNQTRFKENFSDELKNLIEDKTYKEIIHCEGSPYKNIFEALKKMN
jgi:predicted DNA binding CopG/RHH family protein